MTGLDELEAEVASVGIAIGLLHQSGPSYQLRSDFFATPADHVAKIVSDPTQREALLKALDGLLPPVTPQALNGSRTYHPLLHPSGQLGSGELYLTVNRTASTSAARIELGLAFEAHGAGPGAAPSLLAQLPLVAAQASTVTAIIGTTDHPISIELRVPVASTGGTLVLAALLVATDPAQSRLTVRLESLAPGATPISVDPLHLDAGVIRLIAGLIEAVLAGVDGSAPALLRQLAASLPTLLGLADGIPPLPFEQFAHDPLAARGWLAQLANAQLPSGDSALAVWLDSLGRLAGAAPASTLTLPTEANPFLITLTGTGAPVQLALTVAVRTVPANGAKVLLAGLRVQASSVAGLDVAVRGEAVLLSVPLSGLASTTVLERLDVLLTAPASASHPLWSSGPDHQIGRIEAGLRIAGASLTPVIDVYDVRLAPGRHFDVLHLADTATLGTAAAAGIETAIREGLGDSAQAMVGAALQLIGLGTTPGLDPIAFGTAPTRALADLYRRRRATPSGWSDALAAIGTLLGGATAAPAGTGSRDDPWTIELAHLSAAPGQPAFLLALWDDAAAGDDTPRLRLGLRAVLAAPAGASPSWQVLASSELFGLDLPPAGGGKVRLLGEQRLHAAVTALPTAEAGGITISAGALTADLGWRPGGGLQASAALTGLTVSADGQTVTLPTLSLPPPPLDPHAGNLGLPITGDQLWLLTRLLLARAAHAWAGLPGAVITAVLGLDDGRGLGLPAGLPMLQLPTPNDLRSLLQAPLTALRDRFAALVDLESGLAESGVPLLAALRGPLQAYLTNSLPAMVGMLPNPAVPPGGAATWDEPWTVPLHRPGEPALELLGWLDPDGPPVAWAEPALSVLAPEATVPADPTTDDDNVAPPNLEPPTLTGDALVGALLGLGDHLGDRAALLDPADPTAASFPLIAASQALAGTDGLIGIEEALPDDPAWQHGELLLAAHHRLPSCPSAIRQILTACAQWSAGAGAGESVVVLLAPPLAGDNAWDALLSAAGIGEVQRADLRQPGLTPDQVDLGGLQPSSHYLVRLADDGSLSLAAAVGQLDLVMQRIRLVNPSASFILVGHSVCGAVAAGWAAGHAPLVRGLITLGAPLFGTKLAPIADGEPAAGIRLALALAPDGLAPAPVLGDALTLASDALDGGVGLTGFDRLPGDLSALAGRPLLALAGALDGELVPALGAAIASELRSAEQRDPVSHLGYGVRMGLQLPAGQAGELSVQADVRLDLGRLPLVVGAPEPDLPASQLVVEVEVTGPDGGWLLGGPIIDSGGTRLRRAQFQVVVAAGGLAGAGIRLHDLAVGGSSALVVDLDHPLAAAGLAALASRLHDGRGKGGPVGALVAVLEKIGLLSSDGTVRPDVLAAVAADPVGQLGPVLPGLLDAGLGFGVLAAHGTAAGLGPWRLAHPRMPVELVVQARPWRVTVQTTGDGLPTAGGGRLVGSGTLALADLRPSVHASQSFYGLAVQRDPATGHVQLSSPWLAAPVTLLPPDGPALQAALLPLLGRLLADAAITALVQALAGDGDPVRSLSGLAIDPAGWLLTSFGNGTLPDPAAIDALLRAVADAAGLPSDAGRPLILPGGIGLTVAAAGTGLRLGLSLPKTQLGSSPQPASDPTLALDLGLSIDASRHVQPAGTLTLTVPLPGATGWSSLAIRLADDPSGLAVAVDLTDRQSTSTVTLLPRVAGLADLVSKTAARLLPEALDALVNGLSAGGRSALLSDVLAVASALNVYDPAAGFAAKQAQLVALADDLRTGNLSALAGDAATAANALLRQLLPAGWVPSAPPAGTIAVQLPVLGGTVAIGADLSHPGQLPGLLLQANGLTAGILGGDINVGLTGGALTTAVSVRATLDTGRGVLLTPRLDLGLTGGTFAASLRPLGDDRVILALAPQPKLVAPTTVGALASQLVQQWVLPLGSSLLFETLDPWLGHEIWPAAGKTVRQLLIDSQFAQQAAGGALAVRLPLPNVQQLLAHLAPALSGIAIPLPGGLHAAVVDQNNLYGVQLTGSLNLGGDAAQVALAFGVPATVGAPWGDGGTGPALLLLDLTDPANPKPAATLRLGGLGVQLTGAQGKPLLDGSGFRLGAAAGYVSADLVLLGPGAPKRPAAIDGAIQLTGLGLPLAPPAGGDGGNAIAASLVQGGGGGDAAPANPLIDLIGYGGAHGWSISFNGQPTIRLDVNKTFGPLHLKDVLLKYLAQPAPGSITVGLDGGASIAGLDVQVQDLALTVPLRHPAEPGQWKLDLGGLAASFASGPISIAGGLLKQTVNGAIEYDGMLTASIAGRGLTAMGSYSRPGSGTDGYASLFVFAVVNTPIGGPPYLFVLGLAGGLGYNRRLLVPTDPAGVPAFPLVQAMEAGVGSSPMDALMRMSQDIPASRGSYWIAAGVKFTTFELLHTTALVYASLDRGLEIGLLGLMRMALPANGAALVSLELGLAARYSTVDQVLSIRATLTRNSWLISQDCRVTGGFAFVTWFAKPEALLTVGGYGPLYHPRPYYPAVPQVGFNWAVGGGIVIKGGAYFTLAPDALAFGGRLEASYNVDPIRIWFTAYLDVLLAWDPFHYHADAGVSVGASFHIKVCFFACVTISVSVSLSATVEIDGPPLHAIVTVDLDIASVTVEFGQRAAQPYLPWTAIRTKYLTGGDPVAAATKTTVLSGLRAPDAPIGADGKPLVVTPNGRDPGLTDATGHPGVPWPVGPAFAIRVESRMPSRSYRMPGHGTGNVIVPAAAGHVDLVPAESHLPPVVSTIVAAIDRLQSNAWTAVDPTLLGQMQLVPGLTGFPAATWVGGSHNGQGAAMLNALGNLALTAPLQPPTEATNTLGDRPLAISSWVDEEPARPLPLTGATGTALRPLDRPAIAGNGARLAATTPVPVALAAMVPPVDGLSRPALASTVTDAHGLVAQAPLRLRSGHQLLRVGQPASAIADRSARPLRHPRLAPAAGSAEHARQATAAEQPLQPGAALVWQADPHAGRLSAALAGDGAARLVALSATGAPLHDVEGTSADLGGQLPVGTATVVVSALGAAPAGLAPAPAAVTGHALRGRGAGRGWQLASSLLQVGRTTLLGHGATVLTATAYRPPKGLRAIGSPIVRVPAASVAETVPATTTVFGGPVGLIVVQADRKAEPTAGDDLGDLTVRVTGGELADALVVTSGRRTALVFAVTRQDSDELRISVASAADWTVAGVVGLRGEAADWARELAADPHVPLVDPAPASDPITGLAAVPTVTAQLHQSRTEAQPA